MKGIILYSSLTGNTKKLAEQIFRKIESIGDWSIYDISNNDIDIKNADVVLMGGWAESGTLNKVAQETLKELDLTGKKLGLFMTMGARTHTEHGHTCVENLKSILDDYDSLGVQVLQGYISPDLMAQLEKLPGTALPESVKEAMLDGVESYEEPTDEQYTLIADFFKNQL